MNKLLDTNYYKFGFGHYWYGYNKRKIGIYCSLPFLILLIISYIILSKASVFGFFFIIIMDIIFIPMILLYLLFRVTSDFHFDWIDEYVIENIIIILILIVINRFMLNFFSEKYFDINLNSKVEFHNTPIDKIKN